MSNGHRKVRNYRTGRHTSWKVDWPATWSNLIWLHDKTRKGGDYDMPELHEGVHDLASAMGAPKDYLHRPDEEER